MISNLKPIANKHSIKRAVATIFLPHSFYRPKDILEKIKEDALYSDYAKKQAIHSKVINIESKGYGVKENSDIGFILESYDEQGEANCIFKLENISENQSRLSFEMRKYIDWDTFKSKLKEDLNALADISGFYVYAINLNYQDEFIWESEEKMPINHIFNDKSDFINNSFLDSWNGMTSFVLQNKEDDSDTKNTNEERIELTFSNDVKRVTIDHQYVHVFSLSPNFNDIKEEYIDKYDVAHDRNKDILKEVLTEEVQELIKLI